MSSPKKPLNDEDSQKVQEINTGKTEKDRKNSSPALLGFMYQIKLILWYLLHACITKHYKCFRLSAELKQAQKFDDVIFQYFENGKNIYRLVQAKHRKKQTMKLNLNDLQKPIKRLPNDNDDFSLLKYLYSYQKLENEMFRKKREIKDLVLFTNIDFDFETKVKVSDSEETLAISDIVKKLEYKDDILDFTNININLERTPACYKFKYEETLTLLPNSERQKTEENKEFFDRLVFAVNQPNEPELRSIIKGYIEQNFNILPENACDTFCVNMEDWFCGTGNEYLINEDFHKWVETLQEQEFKTLKLRYPTKNFKNKIENEKPSFPSEIAETLILKNFLLPENKPTYQILHFESNETELTSIKVGQFLLNTKFQYNFYYFELKYILENRDDLIPDLQKKKHSFNYRMHD